MRLMVYDGFNLLSSRSRIPLQKLLDGCPLFETLKERRDRHSRPAENECATKFFGVALNSGASVPICSHIELMRSRNLRATVYGKKGINPERSQCRFSK